MKLKKSSIPTTHTRIKRSQKVQHCSRFFEVALGMDDKLWVYTPCQVSLSAFTSDCLCLSTHTSSLSLSPSVPASLPVSLFISEKRPLLPSDCLLRSLSAYHRSLSLLTSFCVLFIRHPIFLYFPSACFAICLHLTPPSWLSAERGVRLESMGLREPLVLIRCFPAQRSVSCHGPVNVLRTCTDSCSMSSSEVGTISRKTLETNSNWSVTFQMNLAP